MEYSAFHPYIYRQMIVPAGTNRKESPCAGLHAFVIPSKIVDRRDPFDLKPFHALASRCRGAHAARIRPARGRHAARIAPASAARTPISADCWLPRGELESRTVRARPDPQPRRLACSPPPGALEGSTTRPAEEDPSRN